jgi:ABC-2 type transport system permease protein
MTALLRAFAAYFREDLANMLQYRGESFLWAIWGVVYPAVALAMWSAAAQGSSTPGTIGAYDPPAFAAYFLMSMIVGHVTTAWDAYEMGWLVRGGHMTPRLLHPVLPIWKSLAGNLAWKIITLAILAPIWALVAWVAEPRFSGDWVHVAAGTLATVLASLLSFVWGYAVACIAFWTTRSDAISETWFGAQMIFGGRLAPIELLPAPLDWVAQALPLYWMLGFPSKVLMGQASHGEAAWGLIIQAAWLAGGVLVFRRIWRGAMRQYSAVGA